MNYKVVSLTIISAFSLLTACSANEVNSKEPLLLSDNNLVQLSDIDAREQLTVLKDGLYFAEDSTYSEDGWKNTVTLEIKDGIITTIEFNSINETATEDKRTLSQTDEYLMSDADTESLKWHEQIEKLESYIINNQDTSAIQTTEDGKTDTSSGVTISVTTFLQLMNTALADGPIEKGNYQDGHYYAEQETFTDGYKYNINLIVENGYIVEAHWDAIKEDDNLTSGHSTEEIQNWNHQAQLLESYLINIQDPTLITYNEDNKTDAISGVTIEVNQFIELVIQALASGPTID